MLVGHNAICYSTQIKTLRLQTFKSGRRQSKSMLESSTNEKIL